MEDEYKQPYLLLFNAVTDALEAMERGRYEWAAGILREAQVVAEDIFIHSGDEQEQRALENREKTE